MKTIEDAVIENNWHERGELPPVGVVCERRFGNEWIKTSIVSHHCDGVRAIFCDEGFSIGELGYMSSVGFRPIRTHREKVIEAACKLIKRERHTVVINLQMLYDAGMLVLPQDSGDTKD